MERKLYNCTFAKTILMIIIIIGHSMAFWTGNWFTQNPKFNSVLLNYISKWLSSFHTYTFVLISGYIFAYKIGRGEYKEYKAFMKNKAKRLLIPYWFAMIIWVAPVSSVLLNMDRKEIVQRYVLCTNPSQLWFLWMLFWVFMIYWPLKRIIIEREKLGFLISCLLYVAGFACSMFFSNIFCVWTALQYCPYFWIGVFLYKHPTLLEKRTYALIAIDICLFISTVILDTKQGQLWLLLSVTIKAMLNIIGSLMAWNVLQRSGIKIQWHNSIIFRKLSSLSMPMFLFHQQFIYFSIIWFNGVLLPGYNFIVNFAFSFSCSLFVSLLFQKWKFTRILIGDK